MAKRPRIGARRRPANENSKWIIRWDRIAIVSAVEAFWVLVIVGLSGCATTPVYYDKPQQTINGYDPALRSHRPAIGLPE